jgi:hypothetical protein
MSDTEYPYTVRTRIAHSHTEKRGWRHESTVEVSSNAHDPIDHAALVAEYLRKADDLARAETRTRNVIDGYNEVAA